MISITILHLAPQTLKISLVQSTNLDLIELDFPFVVIDNLINLALQLVIVRFNQLQTLLLVDLEIFVYL